MTQALRRRRIVSRATPRVPAVDPTLDARHEQWLREQYLRDLEIVQREEDRIVEQGGAPCDLDFFSAMGDVIRNRVGSPK
jgi:hypothetical protein